MAPNTTFAGNCSQAAAIMLPKSSEKRASFEPYRSKLFCACVNIVSRSAELPLGSALTSFVAASNR